MTQKTVKCSTCGGDRVLPEVLRCAKCGDEKDFVTGFALHARRSWHGRNTICRECVAGADRHKTAMNRAARLGLPLPESPKIVPRPVPAKPKRAPLATRAWPTPAIRATCQGRCGRTLPAKWFYRNKTNKNGLSHLCRNCWKYQNHQNEKKLPRRCST